MIDARGFAGMFVEGGDMLDGTPTRTVWGYEVATSSTGRNVWPEALKQVVAAKVLDEGLKASALAREIKANETMVCRWVNDERDRRERQEGGSPEFVEVVISEPQADETADNAQSEGVEDHQPAFCLELWGIRVTLSASVSEADIAKVIRGIRAAR
ncbi:hypothetical protein [Rhodovulum sp. P5]|uniref:hypothetical protein n=1 Tax=Rhodovulum sp. P5 TaxID=1564506 RepID=UPI0015605D13|nr:hypothetical protein [Rhodovulum sp. P5]